MVKRTAETRGVEAPRRRSEPNPHYAPSEVCHGQSVSPPAEASDRPRCGALTQPTGGPGLRALLLAAVSRIQVYAERFEIALDISGLIRWLAGGSTEHANALRAGAEHGAPHPDRPGSPQDDRPGEALVVGGRENEGLADSSLTRILVRAHTIRDRLSENGTNGLEIVSA